MWQYRLDRLLGPLAELCILANILMAQFDGVFQLLLMNLPTCSLLLLIVIGKGPWMKSLKLSPKIKHGGLFHRIAVKM
jgi:hypothetical protein